MILLICHQILARAFGRRLPWTALVPFADFLNHTNVQTKYAYRPTNLDENDEIEHTTAYDGFEFTLFPTGSNHYKAGEEVFNSYGRRENDNLLLDYGFAMYDNVRTNDDGMCDV